MPFRGIPYWAMSIEIKEKTQRKISEGKRRENNPNWKGNQVKPRTARGRAERNIPLKPCRLCGSLKSERHHIDDNPYNNEEVNVDFLCRRCHMSVDGRLSKRGFWGRFVKGGRYAMSPLWV